jgi:hypothetical protein
MRHLAAAFATLAVAAADFPYNVWSSGRPPQVTDLRWYFVIIAKY